MNVFQKSIYLSARRLCGWQDMLNQMQPSFTIHLFIYHKLSDLAGRTLTLRMMIF